MVEANDIKVYSSNYALYSDMSQRVMGVLQSFTLDVEIYLIDEAFMLLSGCRSGTPMLSESWGARSESGYGTTQAFSRLLVR